ncbi:uncharacterized protein B0H18DRAFT_1113378 [Fomitopsis serialis]|uniref:uncharacterized protein n=1 Tax=Fomitopsis serialis TaxID=139415 RepID=UPI0020089EC7|nr:uncharacterized protein B0H18DRAFT_1113378 [Neoantrodia serialis]KAH9937559.1 hypothetical protein B0H18DRAFT_1113378 [Neoantrodia serialis]
MVWRAVREVMVKRSLAEGRATPKPPPPHPLLHSPSPPPSAVILLSPAIAPITSPVASSTPYTPYMTSGGRYSRRRRSQSASSPARPLFPADDPKWRISNKRTRLSNPRSPSYRDLKALGEPPEKWDVDQWRRGKRARRDTSPNEGAGDPCMAPFTFAPSSEGTRHTSRHSPLPPLHDGTYLPGTNLTSSGELEQLRSHAFSELQRSVEESGEGQVRRLRDWENSRSRQSFNARNHDDSLRRRIQPASPVLQDVQSAVMLDEEDDIEIVSSELASGSAYFRNWGPSSMRRSMSFGVMDVDIPDIEGPSSPFTSAEPSERCCSPVSAFTGPSAYSSDDGMSPIESDSATRSSARNAPALTYSYTASSNPSVVSLSPNALSPYAQPTLGQVDVPASATREEKAIAALTLAMANGACGINDYSAIQHTEGALDPSSDDCQVGELWH